MGQKSFLWIGVIAGICGGLVGLFVRGIAEAADYDLFPFFSGAAAFICAAVLWWWLLSKKGSYTLPRGLLAGGLTGLFAHYLCWYLLILAHNICYFGWGGCTSSLGEPPVDLLNGLWASAGLSIISLIAFGWLTVPLGALIAGLVAKWYSSRNSTVPPTN